MPAYEPSLIVGIGGNYYELVVSQELSQIAGALASGAWLIRIEIKVLPFGTVRWPGFFAGAMGTSAGTGYQFVRLSTCALTALAVMMFRCRLHSERASQ